MDFFRKTKGAVSLFLVIILLPVMTVSGLFVDLGRVAVSKEVVSTSADLALSTVLSQYDTNLKDYFGLLASCKDTSEAIAVSKEYFEQSLASAGVDTSLAGIYIDEMTSLFGADADIRDMLLLSVDGDVSITPTKNGAMNNPALIKEGIVEFMKYRAPVNQVADLFTKIAESGVAEQAEVASKETTMTEKKKIFYEKEEALIKKAKTAYELIKDYQNFTTSTGKKISSEAFLDDLANFLEHPTGTNDSMEAVFKKNHIILVKDLYNTHNANTNNTISLLSSKKSITNPGTITTYSSKNKASAERIKSLLTTFNNALINYKSAQSSMTSAWNNVGALKNTDYPIQYWVALTNACASAYSTYATRATELWRAAAKLKNAIDNAADGALETKVKKSNYKNSSVTFEKADSDGKLTLDSLCTSLMDYYNNNYKSTVTSGGSSAFKNVSTQIGKVNTKANKDLLDTSRVNNVITISVKLNKYLKDFDTARTKAKDARDAVNKLKKALDEYKTAFSEWKTAANDPELKNSALADKDREIIGQLEDTGIEKFSKESVTELYDRLDNIYTLWDTFHKDVKAIKYKSKSVIDIAKYKDFRTAANLTASKIVRNKSNLESYANSSFSFTMGTEIRRVEIYDNRTSTKLDAGDYYAITDSFHPNIEKTSLELYNWMKYNFDKAKPAVSTTTQLTGTVDDEDSADDAKDAISGKSEETPSTPSPNATGKNFSDWSGATLPSKDKNAPEKQSITAKMSEVGTYVANLFSNFSGTMGNSLVNMRDDLFAMDYIFSMFTHDTFAYEGCYDKLDDSVQKELKASTAVSQYKSVEKNWTNSRENRTLTLTPRNVNNNWAYGAEIEYILYGNGSNALNVSSAYASIFIIRYALDLPAVFNCYWDDPALNTLATILQALAYIPVNLTKTLACLAITAAEAAVDINQLSKGMPVMFIKIEKDDLVCNYQKIFNGGSDTQTSDISDKFTLQYSDYLKIFLYLKMLGGGENMVYVRVADVIQANMTLASGDAKYSLASAQVFYDFKATVVAAPMWSYLLAVDNIGDVASSKNWRSMTITMTRGY